MVPVCSATLLQLTNLPPVQSPRARYRHGRKLSLGVCDFGAVDWYVLCISLCITLKYRTSAVCMTWISFSFSLTTVFCLLGEDSDADVSSGADLDRYPPITQPLHMIQNILIIKTELESESGQAATLQIIIQIMWKWKWPFFRKERRRQRQREKKRRNQRLTTESCKFSNMTTKIFPSIGNGKPQKNQIPRSHFPLKLFSRRRLVRGAPVQRPDHPTPILSSSLFSSHSMLLGNFQWTRIKTQNPASRSVDHLSEASRQDSTQPLTTSSKTVKTRLSRRWSSL